MTLQLEGLATFLCDLPLFLGTPVAKVSLVAEQPRVQLKELCYPLVSGEGAMRFVKQLARQLDADSDSDSDSGSEEEVPQRRFFQ